MKILILALLCLPFTLIAQEQSRKIEFPDIPGYETLVCNLHQHIVFSDFERRSMAWHRNSLIGKEEFLVPLIESRLEIKEVMYPGKSTVAKVVIQNCADANYVLNNQSQYRLHEGINVITLKAHKETVLQVKTLEKKFNFNLSFQVLNALTKPDTHPVINMALKAE